MATATLGKTSADFFITKRERTFVAWELSELSRKFAVSSSTEKEMPERGEKLRAKVCAVWRRFVEIFGMNLVEWRQEHRKHGCSDTHWACQQHRSGVPIMANYEGPALGSWLLRVSFGVCVLVLAAPSETWLQANSLLPSPVAPAEVLALVQWMKWSFILFLTFLLLFLELFAALLAHAIGELVEALRSDRRQLGIELLASIARVQIWRHALLIVLAVMGALNALTATSLGMERIAFALFMALASMTTVVWSQLAPIERILVQAIDLLLSFGRRAQTHAMASLAVGKSLRLAGLGALVAWSLPVAYAYAQDHCTNLSACSAVALLSERTAQLLD